LLQSLQPLGVRYVHATVLAPPSVKRGITETMLAAQFLERYLGLLQKTNSLFLRKALLHAHFLL
jgi:hypothetical protein